jgi:hypothetical protein
MPTLWIEHVDSQDSVRSENETNDASTLHALVTGTEDHATAKAFIIANAPAAFDGLDLESYRFNHLGGGVWDVHINYSQKAVSNLDVGESNFTFDTTGGTTHITNSLQTIQRYPLPGKPPIDFKGGIGVTHDAVEGVDITVPVFRFAETHMLDKTVDPDSILMAIFNNTGKVNGGVFRGFQAGEVLFLGASGTKTGDTPWTITYNFAASPNVTGLSVGGITGINKKGWEYLWVRFADTVDANRLIKSPIQVNVEKVYESGNFNDLDI